jgi:hypothetical protein
MLLLEIEQLKKELANQKEDVNRIREELTRLRPLYIAHKKIV